MLERRAPLLARRVERLAAQAIASNAGQERRFLPQQLRQPPAVTVSEGDGHASVERRCRGSGHVRPR